MTMPSRSFLVAALLLMLSFSVRGEPLRLAVSRGPVSLPVYVAEDRGYFADEGVDVRSFECASGRDCFRDMAEGRADLATAAEFVVTLTSQGLFETAVLASISRSSRHLKMVARRSAGIAVPEDMRGKRLGTAGGTSAQYYAQAWLLYQGIDTADVSVRPYAPPALTAALERREVDAIAIWEPVAGSAVRALGADAVVLPNARAYEQHFTLMCARAAVGPRAADLVKVLRALARAETLIADDPDAARRVAKARLGPEGADKLEEHEYRLTLTQSLITTMEAQARWAVHEGLLRTEAAAELMRAIEPGPLRQAAPRAVTLVR